MVGRGGVEKAEGFSSRPSVRGQLESKYLMRDADLDVVAVGWICFIVSDEVVHLWGGPRVIWGKSPYFSWRDFSRGIGRRGEATNCLS
jgi:hypothetical protein